MKYDLGKSDAQSIQSDFQKLDSNSQKIVIAVTSSLLARQQMEEERQAVG